MPTDTAIETETRLASLEERLEAIVAISRAVAEAGDLRETLDHISHTAAELVRALAAAIVLRTDESGTGLAVAGAHGLSERYIRLLNEERPLELGRGPSGLAYETSEVVALCDMTTDAITRPWAKIAREEGYRALVTVPLAVAADGPPIGVLNVYRSQATAWTQEEIEVLVALADHAAIAIRTANLLDESRRQVDGLSLLVRSLRAQAHEHSNRLHAIYGLLTYDEVEKAKRLIAQLEDGYHSSYAHVTGRIENAVIAGFLLAEAAVAQQSEILVQVDRRSRLTELPRRLSDLDAVTLIGNLVHNAVEAVADMPRSRRRVTVRIRQTPVETQFRVRDWGRGIDPQVAARIFDPYTTTKDGHSGIGLSPGAGLSVTVSIPA
jgi:signal transduction histidine kinase